MSKVKVAVGQTASESGLSLTTDWLVYLVSLVGVVLLPVVAIPFLAIPLLTTKVFWVVLVTLTILVLWLIGRLQSGILIIPKSLALLGGLLTIGLSFISSLSVANSRHSLIGSGFDRDSTITISVLFLLFFVLSMIFSRREKVLNLYVWLFGISFIVGLYSLVKILTDAFFPVAILALAPADLIGSWYNLGIFFGFIGLSSLVILELFPVNQSRWFKYLLLITLDFAIVILALVNFYPTWIIFGLSALLLFVYSVTIGGPEENHLAEDSLKKSVNVFRPSFAVLLISLFFVVLGGSNGLVGDLINRVYNQVDFTFIDVRPTWSGTGEVVRQTLKEHLILGIGPNNFSNAWSRYKPSQINELPYWNTDFDAGIGLLPSLVATNGLAGTIAWLVFLIGLFLGGVKGIFSKEQNTFSRLIIFLLFVSSLYLWIFAFIYPVSVTLLALAFIISGLLIAQLVSSGVIGNITLSLTKDPRVNFVSVLVIVVLIMAGITGAYLTVQKYYASGVFFTILNDQSKAIDDLERGVTRVIGLDDSNPLYYRTLADIKRTTMIALLQSQGLSEDELRQKFQALLIESVTSAQQAINLNNQDSNNLLSLGLIYELLVPLNVQGAADQAQVTYQKILALSPNNPAILVNLARLAFTRGDVVGATDYLNQALKKKTNYTNAMFMLAQIDLSAGRSQEAVARAEQAVLIIPNDVGANFQLGFLRYRTDDLTGAVTALERAVALSPGNINANAQYFLGLSYDRLGRASEAITQFESIQKFNQSNTEIGGILNNLRAGRTALSGITDPDPESDIEPPVVDQN